MTLKLSEETANRLLTHLANQDPGLLMAVLVEQGVEFKDGLAAVAAFSQPEPKPEPQTNPAEIVFQDSGDRWAHRHFYLQAVRQAGKIIRQAAEGHNLE